MKTSEARLLVVDAQEMDRDILKRRLLNQGHSVTTAASGQEALNLINMQEFDLIFLEIEMAGISGLDVLSRVRELYTPIELPVIMVTALTDEKTIVVALDLGANDYITKPINFAVAFARVRTQLSVKRTEEARKETEESYALALAGSNDGIWDWNLKTNEILFSGRWKATLGYEEHQIGSTVGEWFDRVHPEDRTRLDRDIRSHIDGAHPHFESEHRLMHRDGTYLWILSRAVAVRDQSGIAYRIAGSQTDVTAAKTADPLTGLSNRALFADRLSRLAERAKRRPDALFAVLFFDIDRFKLINDSLGHLIGDQLLIAFARRLEHKLRSSDVIARLTAGHTFARLGGDEFTVLLEDLQTGSDALRVAGRLAGALQLPFSVGGHEISITASIGVSLSTTDYEQPEDLLQAADIAMYKAKASRQGRIEVFDAEMKASVMARLQLETELRLAVERREFQNWYQLIVDLDSGDTRGFEALVRWRHPSCGWVQPARFIQIAEETGVIIPLGRQVLKEACRQLKVWHEIYPMSPQLTISVNVSCKQLLQRDFVSEVRQELDESGIEPSCLKLEITESLVLSNPEQSRAMLQQLKALGVRISMDDFGTGYSSLSYLHNFPIDTLKIDQSFVRQIESNSEKLEIVRAIIALARNLGLEVIAEGIETPEQMLVLQELGCECGQGYLFSRPLEAAAATDLLMVHSGGIALRPGLRDLQNGTNLAVPL